jgi:putative ABC transport system substrate-binding protein
MGRPLRRDSRRQFLRGGFALASLGLLSGCGLLPLQTRQPPKLPRLGFLTNGPRDPERGPEGVLLALGELGYAEGRTVLVERRSAETAAQLPALAAELVALGVDVLVPGGNLPAQAAKAATDSIPIVLVSHTDPLGAGLVASFARPGGNVTGTTDYSPLLAGKRLQTLRELVGGEVRLAYLVNPNNVTASPQEWELLASARTLGIDLLRLEVRSAEQLEAAFLAATDRRAAGVVVLVDGLLLSPERARIAELALQHRLPSMFGERRGVAAGGLISYGIIPVERYQATAAYIDEVLQGAQPAELPIDGPTTFELVVNLKTARALALGMPNSLLVRADEVIE